jgi:hypothetical protein
VEPVVVGRERAVLRDLFQLVAERALLEPRIDAEYQAESAQVSESFEIAYQGIIVRFASENEALQAKIEEARRHITQWSKAEHAAIVKEHTTARARILGTYGRESEEAKADYKETRWTVTAVYEGCKNGTETRLQEGQRQLADALVHIKNIEQAASDYLQEHGQSEEIEACGEPGIPDSTHKELLAQLHEYVSLADRKLLELRKLSVPKYLRGERLLWVFAGLWLLSFVPSILLLPLLWALAGSFLGTLVVAAAVWIWLHLLARAQIRKVHTPLARAVAAAKRLYPNCELQLERDCRRELAGSKRRYVKELRQAGEKFKQLRHEYRERRSNGLQQAVDRYKRKRAELKERRAGEWSAAATSYRRRRVAIQGRYEKDSREAHEGYARQVAERKQAYEEAWQVVAGHWVQGLARLRAETDAINRECNRVFPSWVDSSWDNWTPARDVPPVIRFGICQAGLAQIPNGPAQHPRLQTEESGEFTLPAFVPFPDPCAMLIHARDEGRIQAAQVFQAVMFRLVTSLPPGKVRFTIIDPVGLGRNFASFMHLADHDEALVTSRIWTEAAHIEQRLADLTGHMENVIQKYLRNQFESIEEYNVHAGEVAEPYRILVVANFPFNFTTEAIRRLVSIVHSGPRCGVHTLISVDTKQPMPVGFDLAELQQPGVHLLWEDGRFLWQDDDFENFPLELDAPPPDDICTRVLQVVGERAKEAKRVEVPFEFVAPPPEQWWTGDSRPGLAVPLGRVGATKRQFLKLGQGTAQHVLIAGKTGSGKSTLLHALVSNLALAYSPDEVELYLVDFKKGVEFKTYATHELPHARVVAVESEREFGLSVLQRLDAELRMRGDRFRSVGAQDLRAYRQALNGSPLPRILLIVDEFQEFFVEDDKLAQDASLQLDRLVRQGRAFGLHVLLGSQTLGGAYTLARSTIDQMAVRIALQCSEVDAALILSEDNSAARLLSRPGEAIYNDANGLVEGNNPFQVVWLSEERREHYLSKIQELVRQRPPRLPRTQIVFEGNAPADAGKNEFLDALLQAPAWPASTRSARAWLGESIAIKDPTFAVFRAQSGCNLLIVGQQEDAGLGILCTALISLAAQHDPARAESRDGARFFVLDGVQDDDANVGVLERVARALPHAPRVGAWRELGAIIAELAEEVDRRQKTNSADVPTLYLLVYGLQRFRDLRRADDDFGLTRLDEKPSAAVQFATILREGPALGIHTLVWCDSLNNVNRSLDRQSLREFEMKVLFQMSPTDSSNLIDSPLASKLGLHRAYFYTEEQGKLDKFRPYGIPSKEWLQVVQQRLRRNAGAQPG